VRVLETEKKNVRAVGIGGIYMGADDKGMVSFCELQRQLPADLIGFFRR